VIRGGIWFGLGCLARHLLVFGAFYAYSVPTIPLFMAVVPAVFAVSYYKASFPAASGLCIHPAPGDRRTSAVPARCCSPCCFFSSSGNEYSIAGWLPLFLIRRLGVSPPGALFVAGLLLAVPDGGPAAAVPLLPRVRHGKLALASGRWRCSLPGSAVNR